MTVERHDGRMQVFARTADGSLTTIEVGVDDKVVDLKEAVEKATGIEQGKQCLWLHGEELIDENLDAAVLNLVAEDTVDVCLSGREMALTELRKMGIAPAEWQRQYWIAVFEGNTRLLKLLITVGVNLDITRGSNRKTALHIAAESAALPVIEVLVSAGADIDIGSRCGWTALSIAAWNGFDQICGFLLDAGSSPNTLSEGKSPLMHAASLGRYNTCRCLVSHSADINMRSTHGYTALMLAASCGHLEVCRLLLDSNADITIASNSITALSLASANGHPEVAKLLKTRGAKSAINCCCIA
eukprot:TRINITY_DN37892_c0_g1_i1.p1 TRINITY_DN37892_c0_g1~~TRINITY_DN37892_c0_g1_i1.p1  ORF type:complete len:300 (+),score=34.34 TRINITY_DN37892_c0_g1_i1:42-941(+)